MPLTYHQSRVIAGLQMQNLPCNIHPSEIGRYYNNTVEIIFNRSHNGNLDHVENLLDDNHRIIASCMYRPGFLGGN